VRAGSGRNADRSYDVIENKITYPRCLSASYDAREIAVVGMPGLSRREESAGTYAGIRVKMKVYPSMLLKIKDESKYPSGYPNILVKIHDLTLFYLSS
jgi:hypothetical protein